MSNKTPYIQQYSSSLQDVEQQDSSFESEAALPPNQPMASTMNVAVGTALPSSAAMKLPTLKNEVSINGLPDATGERQSLIAEGVNFVGNARLRGVCSVGGKVEGNLVQSPGYSITVIVTESGYVKGDIVASNISIMGQTDGLLDATGGSVTLHDASCVSGHVRYNRLQVNGADLNATLEKATGSAGADTTRNFGSGL